LFIPLLSYSLHDCHNLAHVIAPHRRKVIPLRRDRAQLRQRSDTGGSSGVEAWVGELTTYLPIPLP